MENYNKFEGENAKKSVSIHNSISDSCLILRATTQSTNSGRGRVSLRTSKLQTSAPLFHPLLLGSLIYALAICRVRVFACVCKKKKKIIKMEEDDEYRRKAKIALVTIVLLASIAVFASLVAFSYYCYICNKVSNRRRKTQKGICLCFCLVA